MANPTKFGMPTVMGGIQITPGNAPPSIADFERFAAKIRPSWELDDAPFAATAAMDAVDLAALQRGGGANAEVAGALNGSAPEILSSDLLETDASAPVVAFAAPASDPVAVPASRAVAQPAPQPAARASVPRQPISVRPQPSASSYLDEDLPIKKSKAPLVVGVALVALLGIGGAVAFSGSGSTATPEKKPVATMTAAPAKDIPPPPPVAEIPPAPESPVTPPVTPVAVSPRVTPLPPLPPAPHAAQAAPPKPPPHTPPASRPPPPPPPPAAAAKPPPKAGGGIVRDNPF